MKIKNIISNALILTVFMASFFAGLLNPEFLVQGFKINADNIFIVVFALAIIGLTAFTISSAVFNFLEGSLSYFPNLKRFFQIFYKDIPLIIFGAFALIFEMYDYIKEVTQKFIQLYKQSKTKSIEVPKNNTQDFTQKAALDLLMDDEDEDIEMVHVTSVNQKIDAHDDNKIETLRRAVSGFSDIKNFKFEDSEEDTEYLKLFLSPKDIPLDKNFEIFSTFIQQWPKSEKQRLIMTDFSSLKEPSFMDVVEGRVNLSRVIRKNLAPNTDVLAKTSISNLVSEKKLFSLVSLLKDQYDEVVVLIPEGQESEWKTAYSVFNSKGFVQATGRRV